MILGIVGSEAAKFTVETETKAREIIRSLLEKLPPLSAACSGECPLGGIDIWTREEAEKLDIPFIPYAPRVFEWDRGYKPRNIKIAKTSDKVICITLKELPDSYQGMRFTRCYHCDTDQHVKSGGCWTTKYARGLGKETETIVI